MSNDRNAIALAIQAEVPVLIWGAPGVGKTAFFKQLAEMLKRKLVTVMASVREPQDFAGLPLVDLENKTVNLVPPGWAKDLEKGSIVFFDEISTTAPATQAPLLRTIHERTVGDNFKFPPNVSIGAAANPPEQAAGGWELAPPLANRFFHVDWEFRTEEWVTGFLSGFPEPNIPILPTNWKEHIPSARGNISSFIKRFQSHALEVPKDEARSSRAWPSPRSWEMASILMAAGKSVGADDDLMHILVSGCVGNGAATEFLTWLREFDIPDPEDILKNPALLDLPKRGDRAYAVLASVIAAVAGKFSDERFLAACEVIAIAYKQQQDVAAQAMFALTPLKAKNNSKVRLPASIHPLLELFAKANISGR